MTKRPKLVPAKSGGASRRAYHNAHAKSAGEKVSDSLHGMKLKTPSLAPPKLDSGGSVTPSRSKGRTDYKKLTGEEVDAGFSADFGQTGFTKEDWNV